MTGTMAVLIVVAFVAGDRDLLSMENLIKPNWKTRILVGLVGGIFGIYGNLAGVNLGGAVVSIRDIGPMLAGFMGGPVSGLIAGVIAGAHRLVLGGITAHACIIATCLIGLICGLLAVRFKEKIVRPKPAYLVGMCMETMHLGIVLILVKPFETAWAIVSQIALPFIIINGVGFGLLILIIQSIARRRTMEDERNRLKSELEVAAKIQLSLLPVIDERYPGRDEIQVAASIQPAKEVGGDFYDVFFVDKDHIAVVVADVSGKGIPAALFMVNAKQTIQNCLRDISNLAEAVSTANTSLCKNNEAEMFVTAWIGVLDLNDGTMRYVNAGHNPPVMITREEAQYVKGVNGLVLAAMEGFAYRENSIDLAPGDSLYIYTDGVTEAINKANELYGEDRLQACLEGTSELSLDETLQKVKDDMTAHVKEADQFDDITMMCVRRA